ncbi:MAG TPA: glycosyltransferase [Bryobacteraceae bacterium]|nr:glycosyltransferase [Bryobacteraceae bacterium]
MKIVILGLSITSSWGNGHAVTYRSLVRGLSQRGHSVLFLERDMPWYKSNRDLPKPPHGRTELYDSVADLRTRFRNDVREADLVIVGSYVPEGVTVGEWVTATAQGICAFYDIDTPVTLAKLDRDDTEYLSRSLVMRYDIYLSFTGGPTLERLVRQYRAQRAKPLYCSVDDLMYYPEPQPIQWNMGYLGTYSADRQPALERLMLQPARGWTDGRFCVAGPMYPAEVSWPANVERIEHLPPSEHRRFYCSQQFTLNVTRADMVKAGYSPSVRLFEAAACGTPIISDAWEGLAEIFTPGTEILVARSTQEALHFIREIPEPDRIALGQRGRDRVLAGHTSDKRAEQLESYTAELVGEVASHPLK